MTKKALLIIGLLLALLTPSFVVSSGRAVDILNPSDNSGPCNNLDKTSEPAICNDNAASSKDNPLFGTNGILTVAIRIISLIIGIAAIIMIIINAFKMVISGGDTQAIASARTGLIYALVGLMIAVIAQILVAFVLTEV
ncbi:MAG TPA: hypothetical protein VMR08_00750 [Patescibacteria group bacterium]|jgi:hypothetical protein|nr:hypothetical protein [Patescibacteria group bacterium]